jgi:HEAT repeat protein
VAIDASEVVPALIQALGDESALVRRCASSVLGELGASAPAAVPALLAALEEDDVKNRVVAAVALARMGPIVIPRLLETMHHPNAGVRRHVVTILGKIRTRIALSLVYQMRNDSDPDVRETAATLIRSEK